MKKWILVLTMPSGSLWVLAQRESSLALFPVQKGKPNILKGVFGFDTETDARDWMKKTSALSEQGAKLIQAVQPMLAEALQ